MATDNFDDYINNVTAIIVENEEKIVQLSQENIHLLKELSAAIKDK